MAQSEAMSDMEEPVTSKKEVVEQMPMVLDKCSDSNLHELPLWVLNHLSLGPGYWCLVAHFIRHIQLTEWVTYSDCEPCSWSPVAYAILRKYRRSITLLLDLQLVRKLLQNFALFNSYNFHMRGSIAILLFFFLPLWLFLYQWELHEMGQHHF